VISEIITLQFKAQGLQSLGLASVIAIRGTMLPDVYLRGITMMRNHLLIIALVVCFSIITADGQTTSKTKSRLDGYVAGPYKVLAADFTGDKHMDVVLAYHNIGIVRVYQGDGKGNLKAMEVNVFSDEDRKINPNDEIWSNPHVHNIDSADIDGDGMLDIVFGVGGLSRTKPGRIILARNVGLGRFEHALEYQVPSQAKGVRFADLDNDGTLDLLYTARGSGYKDDLKIGRLYIRRGLGGWRFGPSIEADGGRSAYYIETADLNNDGYLDVLIPNEHNVTVTYVMNPGKKLFADYKTLPDIQISASKIPNMRSHAINDVRAGDFNGDGNVDLVTANLGTSTVSIFPGNGDGTFKKDSKLQPGKNGAFLGLGDFDSDGDVDFAITHWTEDFASVFLNNGDGTFAGPTDYTTGLRNYGIDVADFNHDGHPDIVTANYIGHSISLLMGVGDGTFEQAKTQPVGLRSFQGKWIDYKP